MKTEQSDQPASSRAGIKEKPKEKEKDKDKEKHKHKDKKAAPNKKKINEQKRQKGQEENFKEIYGFFTNQVDVKRFLKQNLNKKDDESDEKNQDEFLNPNEFSEMKGFYDDFNMGDLVIVFQNPDFQDGEGLLKDRAVGFKEAEDVFDKVLTVMTDEGISKSQLKKERDSFLLAYLILDDYKSDYAQQEEEKDKKNEEKANQEGKNQKDNNMQKKEIANESQVKQNADQMKHQEIQKDHTKHKSKKQQSYLPYAQFLEEYKKYLADLKDDRVSNFDLVKKLLEINLLDKQQFKGVEKRYRQGGFSEKSVTLEQKEFWRCKNNQPKDFQTLVRFTMIAKLCRNGSLHCRQFITTEGDRIIVVIKSSKEVITKQAEKGKNTKQLELGYADLFSLEPVDIKYRPLRLNKWIRDYSSNEELQKKLDEYVSGRREDNLPKLKNIDDSLEEHFRNIYQKVLLWDEIDLHALVIKKQMEVDKALRILQKELNIDLSHEKVELMDEATVTTNEWQCYYIYLEYILNLVEHVQSLKSKPGAVEVNRTQAFLYKLIFRKALGDSNQFWYEKNQTFWRELTQDKKLLLNIWDRLSIDPVSPFAEYFKPNNAAGEAMWRQYEINELGWRSEFINMEKIKITQTIVLKNINILKMIQDQYCIKYCPLHDQYQLLGLTKKPLFEPLKAAGYMDKHEQSVGAKAIRNLFNCMKDEAESTDFDGDSLESETKFNYKQPWDLNIPTMRDYYGEKIALYFTFVKYYTKQLWYMALIAIISQGLISGAEGQTRASGIIIFSIAIIIWSTFFIEYWKREQVLFSVQYGQQNFEEDEAERPAFEGQYIRSITNDDLNEEFYSPFSRKMKMLLSLSVSFLIIACIIGCVIGIFTLKNYLTNTGQDPLVISIVPSLLNSIQINFFNFIYSRLVLIFNDYENHKISSSYENSHIAKIFVFMFVNNFNSFFIISFLESYFDRLNLCKNGNIDKDCFGVLQNQMIIIFGVSFVNNIPELATPLITKYLANRNKEVIDPYIKHAFTPIDVAIQEQLGLENYQENPEIDGTVGDYMELIIQFCYLCLFGLAFPSSYLMAFVSNIAEIQVDKYKLVKICIRPFPQGASNIGNWLIILEVITFLAIFSNAGLIVFTSQTIAQDSQLVVFSTLLVVFLVPDEPESARILGKRHQYVVERVVKGFAQAGADSYQQTKFNMKLGGVIYGIIHTEIRNESKSNIDD